MFRLLFVEDISLATAIKINVEANFEIISNIFAYGSSIKYTITESLFYHGIIIFNT